MLKYRINVDAGDAADWPKRTWDGPKRGSAEFHAMLRRLGMSESSFKEKPGFKLAAGKRLKKSLVLCKAGHDVSGEARVPKGVKGGGRWTELKHGRGVFVPEEFDGKAAHQVSPAAYHKAVIKATNAKPCLTHAVTHANFQAAVDRARKGDSILYVATYYKVWVMDKKAFSRFDKSNLKLIRPDSDGRGFRMSHGKSMVYVREGSLIERSEGEVAFEREPIRDASDFKPDTFKLHGEAVRHAYANGMKVPVANLRAHGIDPGRRSADSLDVVRPDPMRKPLKKAFALFKAVSHEPAGQTEVNPKTGKTIRGGEFRPGKSTPGKSTPGKSTPGKSTPGKSKPGKSKPGKSKPGKSKPGKSTPSPTDDGHKREKGVAAGGLRAGDPHPKGYAPTTKEQIAQAAALGVALPPASWGAKIHTDPESRYTATWYDSKGHPQYAYSAKGLAEKNANKLADQETLIKALPTIKTQMQNDLRLDDADRRRVEAAIVAIVAKTAMRIGSELYAKENSSFGASSLRKEHVKVKGDAIHFDFVGKHGKKHAKVIRDPLIADAVSHLLTLPGERVFQARGKDGRLVSVNESMVREYLKPYEVTPKVFRAYAATRMAAEKLKKAHAENPGASDKDRAKTLIRVCTEVSEFLGNTPMMARKEYINPQVIEAYLKGVL